MDAALLALVALACPLGMVLMMVFMGRGMMGARKGDSRPSSRSDQRADDLDALRTEKERLDERIAALESRAGGTTSLH
jgi:hypothetical protein